MSSRLIKYAAMSSRRNISVVGTKNTMALSNGVVLNFNPLTDIFTKVFATPQPVNDVGWVDISPDGQYYNFITGDATPADYNYVRTDDTFAAKSLETDIQSATRGIWSPDGKIYATDADVRTPSIYQLVNGELRNYGSVQWGGGSSYKWSWSPDSNWLLCQGNNVIYLNKRDLANNGFVYAAGTPSFSPSNSVGEIVWVDTFTFLWFSDGSDTPSAWTLDPVAETVTRDYSWSGFTTINARSASITADKLYVAVGNTAGVDIYKKVADKTYSKIFSTTSDSSIVQTWMTSVGWSSDAVYMAFGSPYTGTALMIYKRTGDSFTRVPAANIPSTGNFTGRGLRFTPV